MTCWCSIDASTKTCMLCSNNNLRQYRPPPYPAPYYPYYPYGVPYQPVHNPPEQYPVDYDKLAKKIADLLKEKKGE